MSGANKEYKYKITAVIPVYNVEDYLEETLECLIKQDIGFEENIQIILVNDGSKDDSGEICLAYAKKYPQNIKYIYQENSGVSVARNNGIKCAEGKYINVFDSDDIWSLDTYSKAYEFFEEHYDEVDVVSCKIIHFEAATHVHVLSRTKHDKGNRIVSIHNDYHELQNHAAPCFIKAEAAKKHKYLKEMRYGEDSLYINKIILEKEQYGVLADPVYYYRKRFAGTSAVQNKCKSVEWFLETPLTFYGALMELSREKFGEVIPYYQNLFAYELQWRLREDVNAVLDEEQKAEYIRIVQRLLQECEDDIITSQVRVLTNEKIFLLSLKYGRDIRSELVCMNEKLYFKNLPICNLNTIMNVRADIINVKGNNLYIDGRVLTILEEYLELWFEDEEGNVYPIEKEPTFCGEIELLGVTAVHPQKFKVVLPLKDGIKYQLQGKFKQHHFKSKIVTGKFGKLYGNSRYTYHAGDNFILTCEEGEFIATLNTQENLKHMENLLTKDIKASIKSGNLSKEKVQAAKQALRLRKSYWRKKKNKKKIWLISDRVNFAGDNGEAFFEYMRTHPDQTIEPYYVISSSSKDYKRMKKQGNVIKYKSKKHLLYTLLADKIISSHAEDHIGNPFEIMAPYVRSLCNFDMVFLQHGITKDDLSGWLNKYNKNLGLIITAAKPEYDSIIQNEYNYEEEKIALTGFARYDRLVQKEPAKKQIIILPTWRQNLTSKMDPKTGDRPYNPAFVESEYFKFYNQLINDERILKTMKAHGYTGKFCLHQNNISNVGDFDENDVIRVEKEGINYGEEFLSNSLLITDYSSVAYDFAYLKKPVIYIQFDREEFFENAVYDKGYWDYNRDGFGPICEEYEEAVESIVKTIEADCKIERKYEERIEKFYLAFDQNNSKRIYDAICSIGKCSKEEK